MVADVTIGAVLQFLHRAREIPLLMDFTTLRAQTRVLSTASARIDSEFVLALYELPFYPLLIVSHIGVNTRVVTAGTSFTP